MTGYYQKFIPAHANLVCPLTQLTFKIIPFIWMDQCQKAFETLEDVLMKSPIMVYPDPDKPYTLFMNTLKYVLFASLTQEHTTITDCKLLKYKHPISYVSGLFQGSQLNWTAYTKGAYVIYMTLMKLSYYLAHPVATLLSDYLPLK